MTIVQQRTDITGTDAVARMQAACSGLVAMAEAAYAAVPTSYSYSTLHAVYRLDTEIAETAEALVTLTPEEFDERVKALIGEAGRASKQSRRTSHFIRAMPWPAMPTRSSAYISQPRSCFEVATFDDGVGDRA